MNEQAEKQTGLPSERIREIHNKIAQHMAAKDIEQITRARLMPDCPLEILNITPEMITQQRQNDPHTLLAAVVRFLDEIYIRQAEQAPKVIL